MTKFESPSDVPRKNSSSPKRDKFDFMFMDCCSFLCVGLGIDDDIPPCASIALMDSNDGGDSISDSSSVFHDIATLDDSLIKNEDDTKTTSTFYTISTLTMEKIAEVKKVLPTKEEDEELPSKLILLSENLVVGDKIYPKDEEEFSTLNTLSTARRSSSLDTRSEEIPPSLDTKTFDRTLLGLQLVETLVGETTQEDKGRNFSNRSYPQPRKLFDIERVPSLVEAYGNDDRSIVSAISIEDNNIPNKDDKPREPITNRPFKGKMLRLWSRKNKKAVNKADGNKAPSIWREQSETVPNTDLPTKSSRPPVTTLKPTKPSILNPRGLPKYSTVETNSTTVPIIKLTKSNDVTTSTVGTDEDECYHRYGSNIPFDEPPTSSTRFLAIEKIRVGQYLRPSSNVKVREI